MRGCEVGLDAESCDGEADRGVQVARELVRGHHDAPLLEADVHRATQTAPAKEPQTLVGLASTSRDDPDPHAEDYHDGDDDQPHGHCAPVKRTRTSGGRQECRGKKKHESTVVSQSEQIKRLNGNRRTRFNELGDRTAT